MYLYNPTRLAYIIRQLPLHRSNFGITWRTPPITRTRPDDTENVLKFTLSFQLGAQSQAKVEMRQNDHLIDMPWTVSKRDISVEPILRLTDYLHWPARPDWAFFRSRPLCRPQLNVEC
ncbi:hypothetical protein PILCRDRAFT_271197 [Piloderma croceum F 1598]|uniref:Uncharacterized protein n=1 Tax=Piloderma croceum (strain F 1598) TaxID=765440 RepID=A0A0C3FSV8_PILCF|nr:hypothetical protein PILCRDRAFT_271197 [Piloderma croceum F 1598]